MGFKIILLLLDINNLRAQSQQIGLLGLYFFFKKTEIREPLYCHFLRCGRLYFVYEVLFIYSHNLDCCLLLRESWC